MMQLPKGPQRSSKVFRSLERFDLEKEVQIETSISGFSIAHMPCYSPFDEHESSKRIVCPPAERKLQKFQIYQNIVRELTHTRVQKPSREVKKS
jgi:hypothetical protein